MGEDFTEQDVADELGINQGWVNNAKQELINSNIISTNNIRTRAKKREQVREALEENPEKSNVEIAKELDVSDPFVGKVRKEMRERHRWRSQFPKSTRIRVLSPTGNSTTTRLWNFLTKYL